MLTLGGVAFLLVCVFGVFIVTGGAIVPLLKSMPFELITIGGAAIGTFVASNSMHNIKHTLVGLKKVLRGSAFKKNDYTDLLCLLFYLVRLAATRGAMALEAHIERPDESPVFKHFPTILKNHEATGIICDYLRMVGMNADDPHQIEDVMARELRKTLAEELHGAHSLQNMADGLPALGIVAAVLGVIKTMADISKPPAVLGEMIGDALTGTFLGVLLAYGVVGPLSTRLRGVVEEESRYLEVIRAVLVAHLHGNAPQVSVEVGRKMVPNPLMPTFSELEESIEALKIAT
ncbi:MAG: flagellar motor stator protein MotA [Acidiphilium sp. 37-67-22]|nr:MAG: flagellar motor stator protein MotA [Acidiphilium sp. 37-67-22]HQT72996.1 flagellar motor stator protein MotA [Acidiphilium sp.]